MPRLTNTRTNVRVRVSEEKAERMGSEWEAEKAPSKPAPRKSTKSTK